MANFKYGEKDDFEALLGMRTGYVLDFTNRQFREFVLDSVGIDIDDPTIGGNGSKATRLRHFWINQPAHVASWTAAEGFGRTRARGQRRAPP